MALGGDISIEAREREVRSPYQLPTVTLISENLYGGISIKHAHRKLTSGACYVQTTKQHRWYTRPPQKVGPPGPMNIASHDQQRLEGDVIRERIAQDGPVLPNPSLRHALLPSGCYAMMNVRMWGAPGIVKTGPDRNTGIC